MKSAASEIAMAAPGHLTRGAKTAIIALSDLETGRWWLDNRLLDCWHTAIMPDLQLRAGKFYLRSALEPHFQDAAAAGWVIIEGDGSARATGDLIQLQQHALLGVARLALTAKLPGTWRGLSFGPTSLFGGGGLVPPTSTWTEIQQLIQGDIRSTWVKSVAYLYDKQLPPNSPHNEEECRSWLGLHYHGGTRAASRSRYLAWFTAYHKVEYT